MGFTIRFLKSDEYPPGKKLVYEANNKKLCLGKITIGDFEETFESSLNFWSKDKYEAQWHDAIIRITEGEDMSCLITSMYDPLLANFLTWWPLYREGRKIIVQNHLFFLEEAKGHFDPENPYAYVKKYEAINEDGEKISQWVTSIDEIREFLYK
jgi:hypothetical protein